MTRAIAAARLALGAMVLTSPVTRHASDAPLTVTRSWYPNGQIAQERSYLAGRETGLHRGWWPNGMPKFVYAYAGGLLQGESREWFQSGALWRDQHYEAGHESGLQRLYWEDGRVRASYEVHDGRRYGLMGAKGCATRTDSAEVAP
jgi:antitoxin component YwqK of YwqJK toxin-antitoxin module